MNQKITRAVIAFLLTVLISLGCYWIVYLDASTWARILDVVFQIIKWAFITTLFWFMFYVIYCFIEQDEP